MTSLGSPAYKTPLASEDYKLDGSNQHSSGSWKRFASMRTGEVMKIVNAGYTVLHTDCDVVFLRDPSPYLMCDSANWGDEARYPCAGLAPADVAVSSDNMSPDRDHRGHAGYSGGRHLQHGPAPRARDRRRQALCERVAQARRVSSARRVCDLDVRSAGLQPHVPEADAMARDCRKGGRVADGRARHGSERQARRAAIDTVYQRPRLLCAVGA